MSDNVPQVESTNLMEVLVAVKIVHTTRSQEVRFGDRPTAEHYAAQHGGLGVWRVLTIPRGGVARHSQANVRD